MNPTDSNSSDFQGTIVHNTLNSDSYVVGNVVPAKGMPALIETIEKLEQEKRDRESSLDQWIIAHNKRYPIKFLESQKREFKAMITRDLMPRFPNEDDLNMAVQKIMNKTVFNPE
jgi:phage terminase large subunit-like protein